MGIGLKEKCLKERCRDRANIFGKMGISIKAHS
jgi:hypothetical protein